MHRLIEILGVEDRRIEDPSWVLPCQDAILAGVEDPAAVDLTGFWTPLRRTIRALGVDMTPSTERALTQAAQSGRAALVPGGNRARELEEQIDGLVYELFDLTDDRVRVIEAGPPELAGVSDTELNMEEH